MRLVLGVILLAAGAFPVLADEVCEAEFRTLMQQGKAGFPYAAIIKTEFAGGVTEAAVVVTSAEHSMTLHDKLGQRYIMKGNRTWLSIDKGKIWKLFTTSPKDTVKKAAAMSVRQALGATKITCVDDVELQGKNYRLVQGNFTIDNTKLPVLQKFYVTGPGKTWQVTVAELTVAGKLSVITTTKTKSGKGVEIPEMD